jgi:hypothetical protein
VTLSPLEQKLRSHRSNIQKQPMERLLYLFEYRFLSSLREPRNKPQILLKTWQDYKELDHTLKKYQYLNLIKVVDYDPNKFMLTPRGVRALYLIVQLNRLLEKYTMLDSQDDLY